MAVKVAINGFGRIGRLAFRQMFDAEGYEVVAINDLTKPSMLAYLLKYDSSQGKYEYADTVSADDEAGTITVKGKTIKIYAERDAKDIPWAKHDVDVVLECTGFYTSKEKASAHLAAGAKKVVISAPAGNDLPTIVYNTNHKTIPAGTKVISAASCTTNCLAPMADALNKFAPIKSGIMQTIHAFTGDQMVLDGPQRKGNLRRSRAASENIVPASSGAAKAIGLVLPDLNGKLIGAAQRVPTPTGSTTLLYAVVEGEVTVEGINAAMKLLRRSPSATTRTRSFRRISSACVMAPCSMLRRRWFPTRATATPSYRLFPGTITRTPTRARWFARSNTSLRKSSN